MFEQADVGSIAEIAQFQAALAGFADSAKQAITTIDLEIRRAVDYIRVDRVQFWQNEIRRSYEAVARAKDELHHCLSFKGSEHFTPSCIDEKKALQKAQLRQRTAEEKADLVKHWARAIQHELNEYAGRMTQFSAVLDGDVPAAMTTLTRILAILERYVSTTGPGSAEISSLERSGSLLETAAAETAGLSSMARPTDSADDLTPRAADLSKPLAPASEIAPASEQAPAGETHSPVSSSSPVTEGNSQPPAADHQTNPPESRP